MVQAHPCREWTLAPRDRYADHEVGIQQVGRRRIHIELGENTAQKAHLPAIAPVSPGPETEILAETDRSDIQLQPRGAHVGRLIRGKKLRLFGIGHQRSKHVVGRQPLT